MAKVEDLVSEYLATQNLEMFAENELGDAIKLFVDKDDNQAISKFLTLHNFSFINNSMTDTRTHLQRKDIALDAYHVTSEIANVKKERVEQWDRDMGSNSVNSFLQFSCGTHLMSLGLMY